MTALDSTFKPCICCGEEKTLKDFPKRKTMPDGRRNTCKSCTNAAWHEWVKDNPEKRKEQYIKHDRERRIEALHHYGGTPPRCACCGETRILFLCIDHINGGGSQERKRDGQKTVRMLKARGFPEGYRVLCHNCNMSLGFNGFCPHELERNK